MKKNHGWIELGVTYIEMVVTLGIALTLLGIATISLSGAAQTASIHGTAQAIISDIKSQQIKAMVGDTEGRTQPDSYGIHFDSTQYVLFHGAAYSSADESNFAVSLSNLRFENPGFNIIFSKTSGGLSTSVIIDLRDVPTNKLRRIHLNIYGVITQVESL